LLSGLFLFLSFVVHSRLSTTEISFYTHGNIKETHTVHIVYYGYPFEMVGMLNPFGFMENYWVEMSGGGLLRIFWSELFLNFVLYFLLAFFIVFLFRRLRG